MSLRDEMLTAGFSLDNAEDMRRRYKAMRWPSDPTTCRWRPEVVDQAVDDLIALKKAGWRCTAIVAHPFKEGQTYRCTIVGSEIDVQLGRVLCPRHVTEQGDAASASSGHTKDDVERMRAEMLGSFPPPVEAPTRRAPQATSRRRQLPQDEFLAAGT